MTIPHQGPGTGSPAADGVMMTGRRVFLGYQREPGTITRCVVGNPDDERRWQRSIVRYDVLLDNGRHAFACPAIDVAPIRYAPEQLAQDVTATEVLAKWIARSRGQLAAYEAGGTAARACWQAAVGALHEIDLARHGREYVQCSFTWPVEGVLHGCGFYAEPGRGWCGIHLVLPENPYRTDPIYSQRASAVTRYVEPLGVFSPQGLVTA